MSLLDIAGLSGNVTVSHVQSASFTINSDTGIALTTSPSFGAGWISQDGSDAGDCH